MCLLLLPKSWGRHEEYQFVYDADVADALRRNHPDLDVPEFGEPRRQAFKPKWYHIDDLPFSEFFR